MGLFEKIVERRRGYAPFIFAAIAYADRRGIQTEWSVRVLVVFPPVSVRSELEVVRQARMTPVPGPVQKEYSDSAVPAGRVVATDAELLGCLTAISYYLLTHRGDS